MNVLLVEDDARIASFLCKGLGAAGFIVDWAATGTEGLARARMLDGRRPDIVVLDLGLPDLDGLDVLAALRRSGCQTRVVVLTARSEAADRARAAELGIHHYLTKPFAMAELVASLRSSE